MEHVKLRDNILNLYRYGSSVYGSHEPKDRDYIAVLDVPDFYYQECSDKVDITYYGFKTFQSLIDEHEISALECIFLPNNYKILNKKQFVFTLNKSKLRNSISSKSNNSFVKCKKKLIIEESYDPYIAKKSLFMAFQKVMFGKQIAIHGKIIDYAEANYLWDEIIGNEINEWDYYKEKYKPLFNQLSTEFRILAPKLKED